MELYTLHPLPDDAVASFLQQISDCGMSTDGNTRNGFCSRFPFRPLVVNSNPRPNELSFAFAAWLAIEQPVFANQGWGLSTWEARIDRGSGMLLRPPSRLFAEAGVEQHSARAMPIRIASGDSMMGGAFVPPRLMTQYLQRLDTHLERSVRRLVDAELDPVSSMGMMIEAARYATQNGFGLYEAIDLLDPTDPASWPPGVRVVTHSIDNALIERIRFASRPPKEPGLVARLFGRRR